jgi:hypothetical protein
MTPAVSPQIPALRQVVRPGASVLDLGGDFGQRAVLACRSGAAHVVSVQSAASHAIAHALVVANRCDDRIELVESLDAAAVRVRPVDVILAEEPGGFVQYGRSLVDVLRRFGSPSVTPIPRREQLFAAVVSSPEAYAHHVSPWNDDEWGIAFGAARHRALNIPSRFRDTRALAAKQQLGPPVCWATIDYTGAGLHTRTLQGRVDIVAADAGIGHGLVLWSVVELADGIRIEHVGAFFPWLEPVALTVGDSVALALRVDAVGGSDVWSWTTDIHRQSKEQPTTRFRQSTFFGNMESPMRLRIAESDYRPSLSEAGRITHAALRMMGDGVTLHDVASRLAHDFPATFSDADATTDTLARLAATYTRDRPS